MNKNLVNTPFREAYEAIQEVKRVRLRRAICEDCDISTATFYIWLDNPDVIKKPSRKIISRLFKISEAELFPETEKV